MSQGGPSGQASLVAPDVRHQPADRRLAGVGCCCGLTSWPLCSRDQPRPRLVPSIPAWGPPSNRALPLLPRLEKYVTQASATHDRAPVGSGHVASPRLNITHHHFLRGGPGVTPPELSFPTCKVGSRVRVSGAWSTADYVTGLPAQTPRPGEGPAIHARPLEGPSGLKGSALQTCPRDNRPRMPAPPMPLLTAGTASLNCVTGNRGHCCRPQHPHLPKQTDHWWPREATPRGWGRTTRHVFTPFSGLIRSL